MNLISLFRMAASLDLGTPVGTSSLTQWVLSVCVLPVLLTHVAEVCFSP